MDSSNSPIRRFNPGERYPGAADLNRMGAAVNSLLGFRDPGESPYPRFVFTARVTSAADRPGVYNGARVAPIPGKFSPTGSTWTADDFAEESSTDDLYIIDPTAEDQSGHALTEGGKTPLVVVLLWGVYDGRVVGVVCSAGAQLPFGQYQYQGYQMVSQNTAGWDFVRAHPTL